MDRKVIRTYKDYIREGNSEFDFYTWMERMTEEFDGEFEDRDMEEIADKIDDYSYSHAKDKLAKSRLFNGVSKFSVKRPLKNSAIGYKNPMRKAEELLSAEGLPFDISFYAFYSNDYKNIIYNLPFKSESLNDLQGVGVQFLLANAIDELGETKLFRTLAMVELFETIIQHWYWLDQVTPHKTPWLEPWNKTSMELLTRGVKELRKSSKVRGLNCGNDRGFENLTTVIASYNLVPRELSDRLIKNYVLDGEFPSEEDVETIWDLMDTKEQPNILDNRMCKAVTWNYSNTTLYRTNKGVPYVLPLPQKILNNITRKMESIPNAKGQLKMAVRGVNNALFNPRVAEMMLEELEEGSRERNTLWKTDLGRFLIEQLYDGYRTQLGKNAWKNIVQKHFSYEHIHEQNEDVEIIFSLEKEDILTASSAGNSWSSCHAGTYGHSPIFLAGDEITFIVYEKGGEKAKEGVDSKRWRAYVHLWYDENDKDKMVFSVEHTYPNHESGIKEVIEDIILDGLECVKKSDGILFNHYAINTLRDTASHGYYDYNERLMQNCFTFDIDALVDKWDEKFYDKGMETVKEHLYSDDDWGGFPVGQEKYYDALVKNLGFLVEYCDKEGIYLEIAPFEYLSDISNLADTFTSINRALYMELPKGTDLSFGRGMCLYSVDGNQLGAEEYATSLTDIVNYYYYDSASAEQWYW